MTRRWRKITVRREGILVHRPYQRLSLEQIKRIHQTSMDLLDNPGIMVYHEESAHLLGENGASVSATREGALPAWRVRIPEKMVWRALETAPSTVVLGARDPQNKLILEADRPRVHFGSGSETNIWLDINPENFISEDDPARRVTIPCFVRHRGDAVRLCKAAHLGEYLDNLDFFIRPVNIQDKDINEHNKDVNKFFASLNNITKHVMAGLTEVNQLEKVIRMAEIIAGGEEKLRKEPIISFITSVIKSPLQVVEDTAEKLLRISRHGLPVVISSSPQGGSTAPIEEVGMVSQVNAEVLTGIILTQLAKEGAPVIYGAVPVRVRMDNLHDMYGVPEFSHYNTSCVQMARFYGVPCYSTGGVADAKVPGVQATVEKVLSHLFVPQSGPALIHYSFGLLEETQTFCPEQAVLDNWHIGMVKALLREPSVSDDELEQVKVTVRKVMGTKHRLYARYARRSLHAGNIFPSYPFEGSGEDRDETLLKAHEEVKRLLSLPAKHLPKDLCDRIFKEIDGILPRLNPYLNSNHTFKE